MPARRVAIIVAMARELAPLLRGTRSRSVGGVVFYELQSAIVAVSGIGADAARRASEAVISFAEPEMLVSAGVGGALRRELKTGHVITAREVVDAQTGTRFVTAGGAGVVVTAIGLSGEGDKRMLRESFGGDVVDMEAATVAGVAAKHGLEFAAVKSVSDELDFVMPPLAQFVDASGQFATAKFVRHISVRPHWWGATWNLSKNSRTASVNLSCAVEHLIQEHAKATQKENVSLG